MLETPIMYNDYGYPCYGQQKEAPPQRLLSCFERTGDSYDLERASEWQDSLERRLDITIDIDPNTTHKDGLTKTVDPRTSAEHLENILEVFKLSMTELATFFEVTRQALYKWKAGTPPQPESVTLLTRLSRVADCFREAGTKRAGDMIKMKAFNGQSLLSLIKGGKETEADIELLIKEYQVAAQAYRRSGLPESRATPNDDWQSSIAIPGAKEI
ncbi:MAG: XRE family transcriptional regulator [Candidatus Competibacterales bacterium]